MHVARYQNYILKSLAVSRQKVQGVHQCPYVKSTTISMSPSSLDQFRMLSGISLLLVLAGYSPRQLFQFNRRYKEQKLCGGVLTLRGSKALNFLAGLRSLSLFYSANFRGFNQTIPNKSYSFCPKHLSFSLGARRAFDTGLLGFEDSGLFCQVVVSFSQLDHSGIFTRGFRIPIQH